MTIDQGSSQPDQIAEAIDDLIVDVAVEGHSDEAREGPSGEARKGLSADAGQVSDRLEAVAGSGLRRPHRWRPRYVALLVIADLLAAALASVTAYSARYDYLSALHLKVFGHGVSYLEFGIAAAALWLVFMYFGGAYRATHLRIGPSDVWVPVKAAFRLVGGVAIVSFALKTGLSRVLILVYLPVLVAVVLLLRAGLHIGLRAAQRRGAVQTRLLVVGAGDQVRRLVNMFAWSARPAYEVVGVCTPGAAPSMRVRGRDFGVLGSPDDFVDIARRVGADVVAIANPSGFEETSFQKAAWQLDRSGIDLLVAPDVPDAAAPRVRFAPVLGLPLLHVEDPRTEGLSRTVQVIGSRLVALPLIIFFSPVMLAIAIAVRVTSGPHILYRQARVGYRGREFHILKFRTMVPGAEEMLEHLRERNEHDGCLFKIREDPRVTPVGRFLRRYALDELPQLFNVLKGEMALVGPRPCLASETEQFGEAELRRFLVRPGMTGLWQVNGRSELPWEDGAALDLRYVDSWSPLLDLKILWATLVVVLRGNGC